MHGVLVVDFFSPSLFFSFSFFFFRLPNYDKHDVAYLDLRILTLRMDLTLCVYVFVNV